MAAGPVNAGSRQRLLNTHTLLSKDPSVPSCWGGAKGGGKTKNRRNKYVRNYHETDA